MQQKNWRFINTGLALVVLSIAFFFGMMVVAPKSTDPQELMSTVGEVSGVVGAIGVGLVVLGMLGKRFG
ncbi:MAG TPA: hypothetical protein VKS60_03745 [Stellaceae bacterium]|nr:hypothetical protein [Stellaceae bacterium]